MSTKLTWDRHEVLEWEAADCIYPGKYRLMRHAVGIVGCVARCHPYPSSDWWTVDVADPESDGVRFEIGGERQAKDAADAKLEEYMLRR